MDQRVEALLLKILHLNDAGLLKDALKDALKEKGKGKRKGK